METKRFQSFYTQITAKLAIELNLNNEMIRTVLNTTSVDDIIDYLLSTIQTMMNAKFADLWVKRSPNRYTKKKRLSMEASQEDLIDKNESIHQWIQGKNPLMDVLLVESITVFDSIFANSKPKSLSLWVVDKDSGHFILLGEPRANNLGDEETQSLKLIVKLMKTLMEKPNETYQSYLTHPSSINLLGLHAIFQLYNSDNKEDAYQTKSLAETIAKDLSIPSDSIEKIGFASRFRDVGKLMIPSKILNNQPRLSSEERRVYQTYPVIGYEMMTMLGFTNDIAEWVLYHQERIDGSGYPLGLKDSTIAIEAQIIGFADELMKTIHRYDTTHSRIHDRISQLIEESTRKFSPRIIESVKQLHRNHALFKEMMA